VIQINGVIAVTPSTRQKGAKMTTPSTEDIKHLVSAATEILYGKEKELIEGQTHEQTIAARIMLHLQHLLPLWHVDVEFNRQGEDRVTKRDATGTPRKPDIIIHRRGPQGPNLALVLIKCQWNVEPREDDRAVAQSLKQQHGYTAAFLLEMQPDGFRLTQV